MLDSKQALAKKVESEVLACIGCNDCMLACPLVESQAVSIAELNAAVHLPVITAPNVVGFLAACTQCRQCVPACPADLSRADMVLFNKMKIEDAVPDYVLALQIGAHVVASAYTLDGLAAALTALRLFAGVAQTDLRRLLLKSTLRRLEPGEDLCREGEFHERLYVVLEGVLEQSSTLGGIPHAPMAAHRTRILILPPGSFLGELAVMADQAEPYNVTALEPAVVLEIPKAAARQLMERSPAFRHTMDELYRRRALWTYTRKSAALGMLPEQAVAQLTDGAELVPLTPGQTLVREGEAPRDAYLVRSGFLRVSKAVGSDEVVLVYFREGDLFGALPVIMGEPCHVFSVQASSRAEVVRVPGATLRQIMAQHPQAQQALLAAVQEVEHVARAQAMAIAWQPAAAAAATTASGAQKWETMVQPLTMKALVDAGLAQGKEVLVVDQNRCTHCLSCVDACARRHGYGRLELRGLQLDNLLFPAACRHCEDPVCLLCSVNGIQRLPSGEITIVEDNCIGCGSCAERCPYGNIRMHPVDKPKRGLFGGIWAMLTGSRAADARAEVHDPKTPRKAVKCDLCAGYDDYACVTACPVGAASRVKPADILGKDGGAIGLMRRSQP
jgi:CRP-like cAMP-binding protein/Fe-S-cluster-containing hydrogenase component 2